MAIYFRFPFGVTGDRDAVPYTSVDGSVNYQQGYGEEYSLPRLVNPSARDVERIKMNQILFDITSNLQQYQQHGVPDFITTADNGGTPFAYDQYAVVRYNNGTTIANYISKVGTNTTLPTNATNWAEVRFDPAYLGVANEFTAQQTINTNGSPLVVQSANSTGLKIIQKNVAANIGGIGATAAYSTAFYLSDLTTIAAGLTTAGHWSAGAASTYDLGVSGTQWRNVFADRYTVTGSTIPANGIYLSAANTVGIAANTTLVGTFTSTGLNNTVIGASTAAAGTFTTVNATTYASGAWNGGVVAGQYGGTGVSNAGRTITIGGNFVTSGAFSTTLTVTGTTNVTLPTTGILATQIGAETLQNKTMDFGQNTFTNFPNAIVLQSQISGYTPSSIAGTNTTATLTVSAGQAADSANAAYITKATTTAWAVSNGNALNGYDGGTTLPNSSTIHFFIIQNSSGANQGTFASTSLTPTLPATHTGGRLRRIFSLRTTAAGALIPVNVVEVQGGAITAFLQTIVIDANTTVGTTRSLITLSVPTGFKLQPHIRFGSNLNANNGGHVIATSGDETDVAPVAGALGVAPGNDITNNTASFLQTNMQPYIITNTSGQVGFRGALASISLYVFTRGWLDFRR